MALPVQTQAKYWLIATAVFMVTLWYLGDVLLPFVLGGAVAYFLDPVADRLERMGCSRALATALITITAIIAFIVISLLIIPTLVRQGSDMASQMPEYFGKLRDFITNRFPDLLVADSTIHKSLLAVGDTLKSKGGELLEGAFTSAMSLVNVFVLLVLVPVVAFYLLLDWDNMVAKIDALLPRDHAPVIRKLASDIDSTLASFVRGQGTVCLILGTYYAVALMIVGLNFGLVAGFVAGILTFIPYVGALVGGALAIGLALFQFWGEWGSLIAVVVIFVVGQVVEGNVLTPKLVGSSVGLHPVWLIFALSAFGSIFGFIGMLVAVPVAAALGVVARFAIDKYINGRLYQGLDPEETPENLDQDEL
ncbi:MULTISPECIES: AI-2E family transporter [Halocynthiibacter]|uniref:AI-2E family transporter n=1 Tax=Halocynthiibacter halioticoli TaxID=2986804 RepID=A0AAE3IXG6_9RHOB|nr:MULTISPECIES: AI-2E family transporter [Halocynthiibacter]MCV6823794.1 AI-2E family transporter [Halocynthiibacter halioticoli]MCW4056795.1 AI-2E family transporter [Halocynthiibacter sp. SDUM655004]MDE0590187.1 AI-2E family transporter [Halocynthiibacter sp. C4]